MRALSRNDVDHPSLRTPNMSLKKIPDIHFSFPGTQSVQIKPFGGNFTDQTRSATKFQSGLWYDFSNSLSAFTHVLNMSEQHYRPQLQDIQ